MEPVARLSSTLFFHHVTADMTITLTAPEATESVMVTVSMLSQDTAEPPDPMKWCLNENRPFSFCVQDSFEGPYDRALIKIEAPTGVKLIGYAVIRYPDDTIETRNASTWLR